MDLEAEIWTASSKWVIFYTFHSFFRFWNTCVRLEIIEFIWILKPNFLSKKTKKFLIENFNLFISIYILNSYDFFSLLLVVFDDFFKTFLIFWVLKEKAFDVTCLKNLRNFLKFKNPKNLFFQNKSENKFLDCCQNTNES